jgi:hypothetical protein
MLTKSHVIIYFVMNDMRKNFVVITKRDEAAMYYIKDFLIMHCLKEN